MPLQGEVPWEDGVAHTAGGSKVSAGWGDGAHPHGMDLGQPLAEEARGYLADRRGKEAGCWDGHHSRIL